MNTLYQRKARTVLLGSICCIAASQTVVGLYAQSNQSNHSNDQVLAQTSIPATWTGRWHASNTQIVCSISPDGAVKLNTRVYGRLTLTSAITGNLTEEDGSKSFPIRLENSRLIVDNFNKGMSSKGAPISMARGEFVRISESDATKIISFANGEPPQAFISTYRILSDFHRAVLIGADNQKSPLWEGAWSLVNIPRMFPIEGQGFPSFPGEKRVPIKPLSPTSAELRTQDPENSFLVQLSGDSLFVNIPQTAVDLIPTQLRQIEFRRLNSADSQVAKELLGASIAALADKEAITFNLKLLTDAFFQFIKANGKKVPEYSDIVGPGKAIRELTNIAGEDYRAAFADFKEVYWVSASINVTTKDGRKVYYYPQAKQ